MTDQAKEDSGGDRREKDRRVADDPNYSGPERRKGNRRTRERRSHPRE